MVSALVVCAVVLQNNNLGSIPTVYNFSTSLGVVSLMGKYFFLAQHKQSLPPLQVVTLGRRIKFALERKQLKNCWTENS